MEKLIFSLGLILSSLLGYALQILNRREIVTLPLPIAELRKLLEKTGPLLFMPISFPAAGARIYPGLPVNFHKTSVPPG